MPTRPNNHKPPGDAHPGDALARVHEDHQRVRDLFQDYARAHDPRAQRVIAEEACTEIDIHAQMEEEIFYPAVEDAVEVDRQELVEDSLREHQAIKDVIRELREMSPDDTQFDAKFHELQVLVEYHVAKEEAEMFPLAEQALAEDLDEISAEMQELKQALMAS
jgi:iron-sulfur cluster repair protein YtfE (RIC family)